MYLIKINLSPILIIVLMVISSCDGFLNEEVYTQYDPDSFLESESGINSVLNAAYSNMKLSTSQRERMYTFNEFTGDNMWIWGGGFEAIAEVFMSFTWDPSTPQFNQPWSQYYTSIRDANSLLDNIGNVALSEDKVKGYTAEARFIRAASYVFLWELFGPVPLITTASELELEPSRPTEEVFYNFIIEELQSAANDLPITQNEWGKATKGAAMALLGKFYMNNHQWQEAADIYKEIIDMGVYSLFNGEIEFMFAVENEVNDEIILTSPGLNNMHGNTFMAHAFPPNYPIQSNWQNYGAQYCVVNDWVQTYHPDDERLGWFLFEYTDIEGVHHDLLDPNSSGRAVRSFKYTPDPNGLSHNHGNDIPMIRYAEVILYLSEALNEINGLNEESIDLLNQIRSRAGAPTFDIMDFESAEDFRDILLAELAFEFISEGKRRLDLIRHGEFISRAQERGVTNAKEHMVRFPIPLSEISTNPELIQNEGYN